MITVGPGRGVRDGIDRKPGGNRFRARLAFRMQADANGAAAVAEAKRVGVALRAIANDGDLFLLDESEIRVVILINLGHSLLLCAFVSCRSLCCRA